VETAPFYYFCSNVTELDEGRASMNSYGNPYHDIYKHDLNISQVHPFPPYKEHYSEVAREMGIHNTKPAILINNKSGIEHSSEGGNRFPLDCLEMIVNHYKDRQIYYIRPQPHLLPKDSWTEVVFEDKDFMRGFSNVSVDEDLMEEWDVNFNTMQLIAHSLSNTFFSAAGGNAFMSSLFGGTNTIFTDPIEPFCSRGVWKTDSYLKDFSGAKIIGVSNSEELRENLAFS